MVLYPTGISSEVGLIFAALPHMMVSEIIYCLIIVIFNNNIW